MLPRYFIFVLVYAVCVRLVHHLSFVFIVFVSPVHIRLTFKSGKRKIPIVIDRRFNEVKHHQDPIPQRNYLYHDNQIQAHNLSINQAFASSVWHPHPLQISI